MNAGQLTKLRHTPKLPLSPKTDAPTKEQKAASYEGSVAEPFDSKEFRNAAGRYATGVAVITVGDESERNGMTVNSFTSVSLDPPLISFCPKNESKTLEQIEERGTFAVNVLAADQGELCYQFAGKGDGQKFDGVATHPGDTTGAPLIDGALTQMECEVHSIVPAGDHQIVIGRVVDLEASKQMSEPLLFWSGKVQKSDWVPD